MTLQVTPSLALNEGVFVDQPELRVELQRVFSQIQRTLVDWEAPLNQGMAPAGAMFPYGGTAAPDGWLLCDGASYLRADYAALFATIGTAFGAADGTHFNVPDPRQRFMLGKAAAGTGSTLGGTGGAIDHTHTGPSHTHTTGGHTLITSEIPAHTHPLNSLNRALYGGINNVSLGGAQAVPHVREYDTGSTGGGAAHEHGATGASGTDATGTANPPFLAVNYIIKT